MFAELSSAAAGIAFGFALAAPPGPMNAIIAEESVLRGWNAGFRAGLGAVTADATFFVLALIGVVAVVERFPTLRGAMVGAGGLLMLYFAYGAARGAESSFRPDEDTGADDASIGSTRSDGGRAGDTGDLAHSTGFRKAFVLALTNPYQILFWLTIGVGMLKPGRVDVLAQVPYVGGELAGVVVVRTGSPALLAGFFGGIALWIVGFPAALAVAERRVASFAPAVAALSAAVLAGFGLVFLWDAASTLL